MTPHILRHATQTELGPKQQEPPSWALPTPSPSNSSTHPLNHALNTRMDNVLCARRCARRWGTEMSKTRFLPSRSSQSTRGDRHRNMPSPNSGTHVPRALGRSLHKASRENTGKNGKFCPGRVASMPSVGRGITLVLSLVRIEETGQQKRVPWRGRMQDTDNGEWTQRAAV